MTYKARIFTREELRKAFERVTDVYELSAQLPLETDIDNAVSLMYDHYGEETEVEERNHECMTIWSNPPSN